MDSSDQPRSAVDSSGQQWTAVDSSEQPRSAVGSSRETHAQRTCTLKPFPRRRRSCRAAYAPIDNKETLSSNAVFPPAPLNPRAYSAEGWTILAAQAASAAASRSMAHGGGGKRALASTRGVLAGLASLVGLRPASLSCGAASSGAGSSTSACALVFEAPLPIAAGRGQARREKGESEKEKRGEVHHHQTLVSFFCSPLSLPFSRCRCRFHRGQRQRQKRRNKARRDGGPLAPPVGQLRKEQRRRKGRRRFLFARGRPSPSLLSLSGRQFLSRFVEETLGGRICDGVPSLG